MGGVALGVAKKGVYWLPSRLFCPNSASTLCLHCIAHRHYHWIRCERLTDGMPVASENAREGRSSSPHCSRMYCQWREGWKEGEGEGGEVQTMEIRRTEGWEGMKESGLHSVGYQQACEQQRQMLQRSFETRDMSSGQAHTTRGLEGCFLMIPRGNGMQDDQQCQESVKAISI